MRKHYPLNTQGAEDAGQLPWKDGVPSTGTEGSYPGQALFTDTEAEILSAIDASGQTRNGSDLAQLPQAFARGIYLGQFSGSANALTAAIPNNVVLLTLLRGVRFSGFVTTTNTGGVTVGVVGIGSASGGVQGALLRGDGAALQAGDLPVGEDFDFRYDGSNFRMAKSVPSEQIANLISSGAVLTLINQRDPADIYYDANAASDYQTYNSSSTILGQVAFGPGYTRFDAIAESYVAQGSVASGIYLGIFVSSGGTPALLQSQRVDKPANQIVTCNRTGIMSADPTKSYTFYALMMKDGQSVTSVSGNLSVTAQKF